MEEGYIYLERKILEKGFWQSSAYAHLWVHLLLKASHQETEFLWLGTLQKLKRGQFITGRKILAKETGIPETTIERCLELFEKEGQIGQQKTNKFRLITVKNYAKYQSKRTSSGHLADIQRTHSRNERNERNTLSKDKEAKPRKDKTIPGGITLLPDEPCSMPQDIDHSFPRKRLYGDEAINWTLDYTEHLLGRTLAGQERWNRIYAKHLKTKYGMRRVRECLEKTLAPGTWWFEHLSQLSSFYKHFERLEAEGQKLKKEGESQKTDKYAHLIQE